MSLRDLEHSRRRTALCLAVLACAAAGCYRYAPTDTPPPVGTDVRVALSDEQALRLSDRTGQVAKTYDGRLMGVGDDSVSLSVVTFRMASEFTSSPTFRQTLTVSRDELEHLSVRELSAWRTGVVGVLAAALAYVLVDRVVETGGNTVDDGDDGTPTGSLVWGRLRR